MSAQPKASYCPHCDDPVADTMIHYDGFGNGVECEGGRRDEQCPNCLKAVYNRIEHCVNPYGNMFSEKKVKKIYICQKVQSLEEKRVSGKTRECANCGGELVRDKYNDWIHVGINSPFCIGVRAKPKKRAR
jgi:hypothetical protein